MSKVKALAAYLEIEEDGIQRTEYDEDTYEAYSEEYLVLTDEQATERAVDYIKDSLWAFNADFIMSHLAKPVSGRAWDKLEESIKHAQETLCEDANTLVEALVGENLEEFIEDAISADGRAHFLNTYDGEEVEQDNYYIYRVN